MALRSSEKARILDLLKHLETNSNDTKNVCAAKAGELSGVSRATVFNLKREFKETGTLSSPKRRKSKALKPIDDFDKSVIKQKLRQFYTHMHQMPTLKRLHEVLKEDIKYPGSVEHLRNKLISMGISWRSTNDNRKVLIDQRSVQELRWRFYERRQELVDMGFDLVYLDETWLDTSFTMRRCWQGPDIPAVLRPISRGQRLIVLHAGSRKGFVEGAKLVYKASCSTGDYHNEMDGPQFRKWILERVLPNLTTKSAIVMDNASYHSVQSERAPTSKTKVGDIKVWLRNQGVSFDNALRKPALLDLVKRHKPPPTYAVDEMVRSHGHEVLRLPPYHPEFNAIELIWSQLKSIVRQRNTTFKLNDMLMLADEALDEIGEDRWQRACDHVDEMVTKKKIEDRYRGQLKQKFVIRVTDGCDDSSATDTADDSSDTDTASEADSLYFDDSYFM